jgi:hypothetical protein
MWAYEIYCVFLIKVLCHERISNLRNCLTAWSRVLPEKLRNPQLVVTFPEFYGTRRFITTFTRVRHFSVSWATSIQTTPPYATSWSSILILSSRFTLMSSKASRCRRLPHQNPVRSSCPSPIHAAWPQYPDNIQRAVRIIELVIMQSFPLTCYPLPVRPSYLPEHLILKLHSSKRV